VFFWVDFCVSLWVLILCFWIDFSVSVFFLGFDFYIVWVVISQFSSFASNPKLLDGSDPLNR